MRQNAFIETSAINWLYDAGFDASQVNSLLAAEKLIPIVGMDTVYELARCFTATIGNFGWAENLTQDLTQSMRGYIRKNTNS